MGERAPADASLEVAWHRIADVHVDPARLGSFTRQRVERIIGVVVAIGCAVLGGQALLVAIDGRNAGGGPERVIAVVVFACLGAMILACAVGRGVRALSGVFVVVFVLALLAWPLAAETAQTQSWIYYLLNVGTVAAVMAFPLAWQIVVSAAIPLVWGAACLVQAGFAAPVVSTVALDVSFALIFGGILIVLGWAFRSVAAGVDAARARAVQSYAEAAADGATEQERVSVGALMHDSVLAALIAAERAQSPREQTLAAGMAREALTRLANADRDAGMGPEEPESTESVASRIEEAAADLGAGVRVHRRFGAATAVPGFVARALVLAATQAVSNAVEHADARGLAVAVATTADPVHVHVEVSDTGDGFDVDGVDPDRLGISASIIARMAAVGGRARVRSGPGGTVVTLEWAGPA